jgi:hypothetical protein
VNHLRNGRHRKTNWMRVEDAELHYFQGLLQVDEAVTGC